MLIPTNTNAPLYHYPIGTVSVIVLISVIFWTKEPNGAQEWMMLQHLDGEWSPVQWVTSILSHDGFLHWFFNMIFLWIFGLIVEGKAGWWKFLLIFFGAGILQCAFEEALVPFLPMHEAYESGMIPLYSLGASSAIYALIATALIWAPENDIDGILLFFGIRYITIPIKVAAALYFGLDFLDFMLSGFQLSTGLLHLMGAAFGFPFAIVMLKKGWVDCEGWDWFSRRNGDGSSTSVSRKTARAVERERSNEVAGRPLPAAAAGQSKGVDWGWDNLK